MLLQSFGANFEWGHLNNHGMSLLHHLCSSCLEGIITGRNEVVAKVIFLHLFVILFTGGGVLPQCMLGYQPPRTRRPLPLGADPPPDQAPPTPPQTRHPPGADTPPRKQTLAYGLRAAGSHPTGMHSC